MPVLTFASFVRETAPPWLQRAIGGPLMNALGDVFDTQADRTLYSIRLRFPGETKVGGADEDALARMATDRVIRRGPEETAAVFASRLPRWLDDHATRGAPYALLTQFRLYFTGLIDSEIQLLNYSGGRYTIDLAGDITRDVTPWGGDGSGSWAQIWIFFDLRGVEGPGDALTDEATDTLTTEVPEDLIADRDWSAADVSAIDEGVFISIARDWLAAHVLTAHLVFLTEDSRLWGAPAPLGTWGSPLPSDRTTWGAVEAIVEIEVSQG